MSIFNKQSLTSTHLRNELLVVFGLIVLSFLVFLGFLFPGVSSFFQSRDALPFIIIIVIFIVVIGFLIMMQIINPIIKITDEAKRIVQGDLNTEITVGRKDEIGELGQALNQMTQQLKDKLEELQSMSITSQTINKEINSRIVMLSNLIKVSNLVTQNAPLNEVVEEGLRSCLEISDMTLGCLVIKDLKTNDFCVELLTGKKADELNEKGFQKFRIKLGDGLLGKAILRQTAMVIDKNTPATSEITDFRKKFCITNAVIAPISSKNRAYGLVLIGNDKNDYVCSATEKELLQLISKQFAIAILNNLLTDEIEKLEVTDNLTGLFNNSFTRSHLTKAIQKAVNSQTSCSFVLFSIDKFEEYIEVFGHIVVENTLIKIGNILKNSIEEDDRAARFGEYEFALILPGKNKKEAIQLAEEIRLKIANEFVKEENSKKRLTLSGSVVENPLDGFKSEDLILKCGVLLAETRQHGGNKIAYQL